MDLIASYDVPHWTYGRMVNAGELKHIESGLHDLKIRTCGAFFRFPAVVEDSDKLFLLDGFKKKTNKLEKKDIDRAKNLYKEYKLDNE